MASASELRQLMGLRSSTAGAQVYQLAIRRCMVGGAECLDALPLAYDLHRKLKEADLAGQLEAAEALTALTNLRELMLELVRSRPIENFVVLNKPA